MQAYLQFGGSALDAPNGPFLTLAVPYRETEAPRSGQTIDGYGRKLPTRHMVKLNGRWRRVYAACFGNAASHYIGRPGAWEALFELHH